MESYDRESINDSDSGITEQKNFLDRRKRILTGDGKELTKVSRAVTQAKSYLNRQFVVNHVKIYHGVIELRHLIDPKQMVLLKELYEE